MGVTLKYYKFLDSEGNQSKGVGWILERETREFQLKLVDGKPVVVKDEVVHVTNERVPRGVSALTEITKDEFDALDVKSEDKKLKSKRERELYNVDRLDRHTKEKEKDAKTAVDRGIALLTAVAAAEVKRSDNSK